ncbi:MAG: rhodanese-like domain-containing protein [Lacisediminihabitans sp.]
MKEVTTTEVLQAGQSIQIIDVREADELNSGMIEGAVHLPMSEILGRLGELDRNLPVIAVCRSGGRSASVADALTSSGFECDTMRGGMIQWAAQGLPVTYP